MPKHRTRLMFVFLLSLAGGGIVGGALGQVMLFDLSAASVTGSMLMQQQSLRMHCGPKGCIPFIPASAIGEFDLCGHGVALWSAAIGASTMCSLLFGIGLVWMNRRLWVHAEKAKAAEPTLPAVPAPEPAPTSAE